MTLDSKLLILRWLLLVWSTTLWYKHLILYKTQTRYDMRGKFFALRNLLNFDSMWHMDYIAEVWSLLFLVSRSFGELHFSLFTKKMLKTTQSELIHKKIKISIAYSVRPRILVWLVVIYRTHRRPLININENRSTWTCLFQYQY